MFTHVNSITIFKVNQTAEYSVLVAGFHFTVWLWIWCLEFRVKSCLSSRVRVRGRALAPGFAVWNPPSMYQHPMPGSGILFLGEINFRSNSSYLHYCNSSCGSHLKIKVCEGRRITLKCAFAVCRFFKLMLILSSGRK